MKKPEPIVRNPFTETVERISTLHEQYEEAKKADQGAGSLTPDAEGNALDELERLVPERDREAR